jgi:hypothetical protein
MKNKLFIIILFGLTTYISAILYIPDFMGDDYLIFTYISQHPSKPIALDPNIDFFLFTRPLSYLNFWLDYQLFYNNAVLMKFESLFLFSLCVILLYFTLHIVIKYLDIQISEDLVLLGVLVFLFHPDSLILNIWISNRAELLNLIFYLLSIYSFFLFFLKIQKRFLLISFISFLFAILSKQQGLHLPFILLLFYFMSLKNKINFDKKIITTYFLSSFLILVVITSFNILYGNESLTIALENYWKKPFSLIGITVYALQPMLGERLYNYFIFHKILSLVILILLIAGTVIFARRFFYKRNANKRMIFSLFIFYLISFYPRIFGEGANRINSIQIFWLILILITITAYFLRNYKYRVVLFSILIFLNLGNLILNLGNQKDIILINKNKFEIYKRNYKDNKIYLIADPGIFTFPYQLHFLRTSNFGMDLILNSSIYFFPVISSSSIINAKKIRCEKNSNMIKVETVSDDTFLLYNRKEFPELLKLTNSKSGRGYSSIVFKIPPADTDKMLIYFDGEKWQEL